jgi:hypothetical protein
VLATLGLAVLGPVLAVVVPSLFGPGHERFEEDHLVLEKEHLGSGSARSEVPEHLGTPGMISENTVSPSDHLAEVEWRTGEPELTVPLTIHSGYEATLRIYVQEGNGNTTHIAGLGRWRAAPDYDLEHSEIAVGTVASGDQHRGVIVLSGRLPGRVRSLEDLRNFEFSDTPSEKLVFASAGRYELEIATGPGRALMLEAVVNKDPDPMAREQRASER